MDKNKFLQPTLPLEKKSTKILPILLSLIALVFILPWVAFSSGRGHVTAIDPNERVQSLTAPISGFIKDWHVKEGQVLKKGDLIAVLSDNDPNLMERFEQEKDAAEAGLKSARLMLDTAEINLKRQNSLFQQGLSSRKEYEKAKINYSKLEMEVSKAMVTVTKAETQLSRQASQQVRAPRNGTVIRILPGERGQLIKAGAPIAIFSPEVTLPAVELWVDGVDASMVVPGQSARVQFEGWPSLQVAGWPSIAINTFKAKVHLVDQASSYQGRFRVLLTPDGAWPSQGLLRLGINAKGNIQLADSFILKEIWRKLNNYPAFSDPIQSELKKILKKEEDEELEKGEETKK